MYTPLSSDTENKFYRLNFTRVEEDLYRAKISLSEVPDRLLAVAPNEETLLEALVRENWGLHGVIPLLSLHPLLSGEALYQYGRLLSSTDHGERGEWGTYRNYVKYRLESRAHAMPDFGKLRLDPRVEAIAGLTHWWWYSALIDMGDDGGVEERTHQVLLDMVEDAVDLGDKVSNAFKLVHSLLPQSNYSQQLVDAWTSALEALKVTSRVQGVNIPELNKHW
jgi:hypothetical protein